MQDSTVHYNDTRHTEEHTTLRAALNKPDHKTSVCVRVFFIVSVICDVNSINFTRKTSVAVNSFMIILWDLNMLGGGVTWASCVSIYVTRWVK